MPQSQPDFTVCCTHPKPETCYLGSGENNKYKKSKSRDSAIVKEPWGLCEGPNCDLSAAEKEKKHNRSENNGHPIFEEPLELCQGSNCQVPKLEIINNDRDHENPKKHLKHQNYEKHKSHRENDELENLEIREPTRLCQGLNSDPTEPEKLGKNKNNELQEKAAFRQLLGPYQKPSSDQPGLVPRPRSHDQDQCASEETSKPYLVPHWRLHHSPLTQNEHSSEESLGLYPAPLSLQQPHTYPQPHEKTQQALKQPKIIQADTPMAIDCPGGDTCQYLKGEIIIHNESVERAIPNGLIIMANNTNRPEQGFPYPDHIEAFISREEWKDINMKLTLSGSHKVKNATDMGYYIEEVLDNAAELDLKYFRPAGILMRLDFPGESKYCADDMEIHKSPAEPDDISTQFIINQKVRESKKREKSEKKEKRKRQEKHQRMKRKERKLQMEEIKAVVREEHWRRKSHESLRLVLDPISVLKSSEKSTSHGWRQWQHQCSTSQRLAHEICLPPKNNKPWDFSQLPLRKDRWPPSKHFYYERFRGQTIVVKTKELVGQGAWYPSSLSKITINPTWNPSQRTCQMFYLPKFTEREVKQLFFIPDWDSMDQRGDGPNAVMDCDEIPFELVRRRWSEAAKDSATTVKGCSVM